MNNHWYPGHMLKAKKDIQQSLKQIDIVVELLDARIPYSSRNPLIHSLIQKKQKIVVLNKIDLADVRQTRLWTSYFNEKEETPVVELNALNGNGIKDLLSVCKQVSKVKNGFKTHVMIVGIPNVGKSSLINRFAKKRVANVENRPAVTKRTQWVELSQDMVLLDTPGLLWPKWEDRLVGIRLGATGSIKDEVIHLEEVGYYLASHLRTHYPDILKLRYKLNKLDTDEEIILGIAQSRGFKQKGGHWDFDKAIQAFLHDFRNNHLGPITLDFFNS